MHVLRVLRGPRTGIAAASAVALALNVLAAGCGTASTAGSKSVTTTARGWSVTLRVAKTSVHAGEPIGATLTIKNETDRQ